MELIDIAADIEQRTGIVIKHEMHRGKFNFAAHITSHFLEANPDIRMTADFSN